VVNPILNDKILTNPRHTSDAKRQESGGSVVKESTIAHADHDDRATIRLQTPPSGKPQPTRTANPITDAAEAARTVARLGQQMARNQPRALEAFSAITSDRAERALAGPP